VTLKYLLNVPRGLTVVSLGMAVVTGALLHIVTDRPKSVGSLDSV
jgi:hypothetical protein